MLPQARRRGRCRSRRIRSGCGAASLYVRVQLIGATGLLCGTRLRLLGLILAIGGFAAQTFGVHLGLFRIRRRSRSLRFVLACAERIRVGLLAHLDRLGTICLATPAPGHRDDEHDHDDGDDRNDDGDPSGRAHAAHPVSMTAGWSPNGTSIWVF